MRTQPIPHAYRSFFRQIGLDPDASRIPSEQAAVTRLLHGGFRSNSLVEDALLIALVETGVPVWALDGEVVDAGGLGIRPAAPGDRLGRTKHASHLPPGTLVVVDAQAVHALLFGGFLLLGGRAADLLGRRRVFLVGLVVFTVASLLSGFPWSEWPLIGARALQGLGAAIISPAALSILPNR